MQFVQFHHWTVPGSRVCTGERLSIREKPLHYRQEREGYVSWNAVSSSAADGDESLQNTWK